MYPRQRHIDLGLAISGATLAPGKRRTCPQIAAFCGCSRQLISQIEHRALRKLRHAIFYGEFRNTIAAEDLMELLRKQENLGEEPNPESQS